MKHQRYSKVLLALTSLLILAFPRCGLAQFTFTTNNGAITITSYTGSGGNVVIPTATNGFPIKTIGAGAFFKKTTVAAVTIPDSVTNIVFNAFLYCSLTNVTIGNSVINIDQNAFSSCSNLTSVIIPNSAINIGFNAFYYCVALKTVTIGNSVTTIDVSAFEGCSNLTSVVIPNGVTIIRDRTFFDCSSLTNIVMGTNVFGIGLGAFLNCSSLTSITIPNSVLSIDEFAFNSCSGLTIVTIPSHVSIIGRYAFEGCTNLHRAYFEGDAPTVLDGGTGTTNSGNLDTTVFNGDSGTVYYAPGAMGWGSTFGGWPTVLNVPPLLGISTYTGGNPALFFPTVTGTNFVLQMTTNLASGAWITVTSGVPISGVILTNLPNNVFFRLH
jgi:hypothetical protein